MPRGTLIGQFVKRAGTALPGRLIFSVAASAILERTKHAADESKAGLWNRFEPRPLPLPVYGSDDTKKLPPNRRIRFKRQSSEFRFDSARRTVSREVQEVGFESLVLLLLDSHMWVPTPVANRVSAKPDRHPPGVTDGGRLFREERVLPVRCEQDEESSVADVLKVCESSLLSPRPRPLGNVDSIPSDELSVYALR